MTPDEGLLHEWILEGNFNKVRPRAKPVVKKASDCSTGTENSSSLSFHKQGNNKTGKSAVAYKDKMWHQLLRGGNDAVLAPESKY